MDRPLLILDLDETLIHATETPLKERADFVVCGNIHVYTRPFLTDFLTGCFEHFDVAVWTSSSADYAQDLVKHIQEYSLITQPFRFVWARDRCTLKRDLEFDVTHWIKDLKKVKRAGFDLARTLIVDDSPEKMTRNYGNHIQIEPFTGDKDDYELPLLLRYLIRLKDAANAREIEKRFWRSHVLSLPKYAPRIGLRETVEVQLDRLLKHATAENVEAICSSIVANLSLINKHDFQRFDALICSRWIHQPLPPVNGSAPSYTERYVPVALCLLDAIARARGGSSTTSAAVAARSVLLNPGLSPDSDLHLQIAVYAFHMLIWYGRHNYETIMMDRFMASPHADRFLPLLLELDPERWERLIARDGLEGVKRSVPGGLSTHFSPAIFLIPDATEIRLRHPRSDHGFLSNSAITPFVLKETRWLSAEHYFQAQKFAGTEREEQVRQAPSVAAAIRMGRLWKCHVHQDWDSIKDEIMREALKAKFTQNPDLGMDLLSTGMKMLIEHSLRDQYWSDGGGSGRNRLGELLTELRAEFRKNTQA